MNMKRILEILLLITLPSVWAGAPPPAAGHSPVMVNSGGSVVYPATIKDANLEDPLLDGIITIRSVPYTFPAADGAAGDALVTDGAGGLSFTPVGAAAASFLIPVDTFAALASTAPSGVRTNVWLSGYYAAGDGGEGLFFYAPSGYATNRGTVVAASGGGYWVRSIPPDGSVSINWWGAATNANSLTSIQACFDDKSTDQRVRRIVAMPGEYFLEGQLILHHDNFENLEVDFGDNVWLKRTNYTVNDNAMIWVQQANNTGPAQFGPSSPGGWGFRIKNLNLDGGITTYAENGVIDMAAADATTLNQYLQFVNGIRLGYSTYTTGGTNFAAGWFKNAQIDNLRAKNIGGSAVLIGTICEGLHVGTIDGRNVSQHLIGGNPEFVGLTTGYYGPQEIGDTLPRFYVHVENIIGNRVKTLFDWAATTVDSTNIMGTVVMDNVYGRDVGGRTKIAGNYDVKIGSMHVEQVRPWYSLVDHGRSSGVITAGQVTTTVTASAPFFAATDTGWRIRWTGETNDYTITTYTSPTQVTVSPSGAHAGSVFTLYPYNDSATWWRALDVSNTTLQGLAIDKLSVIAASGGLSSSWTGTIDIGDAYFRNVYTPINATINAGNITIHDGYQIPRFGRIGNMNISDLDFNSWMRSMRNGLGSGGWSDGSLYKTPFVLVNSTPMSMTAQSTNWVGDLKIKNLGSFSPYKRTARFQRSGGVSQITTQVNHQFVTGDTVVIAGLPDASFNVSGVTATVTSTNVFTYPQALGDVGDTASTAGNVHLSLVDGAGITTILEGISSAPYVYSPVENSITTIDRLFMSDTNYGASAYTFLGGGAATFTNSAVVVRNADCSNARGGLGYTTSTYMIEGAGYNQTRNYSTSYLLRDQPWVFGQRWFVAATNYTAMRINVTNDNSAAGSSLLDLQVGGTSKANFNKDGSLSLATGADLNMGTAGVKITEDGDGALTVLGIGDGAGDNDEDLTLNFEDTANTVNVSSSTGVTTVDFGSITLGATALDISGSGAGLLLLGDTDGSNYGGIKPNGTTTTDTILELPAAPFTGLMKSTIGSVTNMVVSSASAGTDYTSPSSTESFTNKTLDSAATGNVLKQTKYADFITPHLCDGTGAIISTNNYTLRNWGHATFDGSNSTNANYVEYIWAVPADINTAVDLTATFKFVTGGTDADDPEFRIMMADVADSADASTTTFSNEITLTASFSNEAANDAFTIGPTTLTGWRSAITAGDLLIIRVARLNNDNDDSLTDRILRIAYGSTQ